jgi:hypothetical protein
MSLYPPPWLKRYDSERAKSQPPASQITYSEEPTPEARAAAEENEAIREAITLFEGGAPLSFASTPKAKEYLSRIYKENSLITKYNNRLTEINRKLEKEEVREAMKQGYVAEFPNQATLERSSKASIPAADYGRLLTKWSSTPLPQPKPMPVTSPIPQARSIPVSAVKTLAAKLRSQPSANQYRTSPAHPERTRFRGDVFYQKVARAVRRLPQKINFLGPARVPARNRAKLSLFGIRKRHVVRWF